MIARHLKIAAHRIQLYVTHYQYHPPSDNTPPHGTSLTSTTSTLHPNVHVHNLTHVYMRVLPAGIRHPSQASSTTRHPTKRPASSRKHT
eukprot:4217533-Amphidinium_carterae.1